MRCYRSVIVCPGPSQERWVCAPQLLLPLPLPARSLQSRCLHKLMCSPCKSQVLFLWNKKDIAEQHFPEKQSCRSHRVSRSLDVALAIKVRWLLPYQEKFVFVLQNFSGASFEAFIEVRGCNLLYHFHVSLQHSLKALTLDILTNSSSLFISLHSVIDVRPGWRMALSK